MKKIILLVCLAAISNAAISQQITSTVLNAAGWCSHAPGLNVSHSVGEPFIETIDANNLVLTQGFLQPDTGICISTSIDIYPEFEEVELSIFPNPTEVSFQVEGNLSGREKVLIYDFSGKLVLKRKVIESIPISIEMLPSGTYVIQIIDTLQKRQFVGRLVKL